MHGAETAPDCGADESQVHHWGECEQSAAGADRVKSFHYLIYTSLITFTAAILQY